MSETPMISITVKPSGNLTHQIPAGTVLSLPQNTTITGLLHHLGLSTEDVMLAFVDGELAIATTPLVRDCRVSLSPYICGG